MRAVKHFIKRFQYAAKGSGTIKINQNDLDALNEIIEHYNTGRQNTNLEDALLLFYILQNWKVANHHNQKIALESQNQKLGIFQLPDSDHILQKITMMLNPKKQVIKEITTELRAYQALNSVPKEQAITSQMVGELLDQAITNAKDNFPMLKALSLGEVKITHKTNNNENTTT